MLIKRQDFGPFNSSTLFVPESQKFTSVVKRFESSFPSRLLERILVGVRREEQGGWIKFDLFIIGESNWVITCLRLKIFLKIFNFKIKHYPTSDKTKRDTTAGRKGARREVKLGMWRRCAARVAVSLFGRCVVGDGTGDDQGRTYGSWERHRSPLGPRGSTTTSPRGGVD